MLSGTYGLLFSVLTSQYRVSLENGILTGSKLYFVSDSSCLCNSIGFKSKFNSKSEFSYGLCERQYTAHYAYVPNIGSNLTDVLCLPSWTCFGFWCYMMGQWFVFSENCKISLSHKIRKILHEYGQKFTVKCWTY